MLAKRYRLVREIGRGGMGVVWLAHDTTLDDREVALKLLPTALTSNARAIARLKKEATTCLELTHPHIVRLINFEQDHTRGGIAFLVMQYVQGKTLDDVLVDHPEGLPLKRVTTWAKQVAEALDHAHAQRILHRDIKPSNIMIGRHGRHSRAYLMDFGIAREAKDTMTRVTGRDSSGTLPYMSPQQIDGINSTSNDIYSLAATLYEAIKGEPPFTTGDISHQIRTRPVLPIEDQPAHVNDALLAGLAKDADDRPATAGDLAAALAGERSVPHRAGPSRPDARPHSKGRNKGRRIAALSTVLVIAIAAVVTWWVVTQQPGQGGALPTPVVTPQFTSAESLRPLERQLDALQLDVESLRFKDTSNSITRALSLASSAMESAEQNKQVDHFAAAALAYQEAIDHLDAAIRLSGQAVAADETRTAYDDALKGITWLPGNLRVISARDAAGALNLEAGRLFTEGEEYPAAESKWSEALSSLQSAREMNSQATAADTARQQWASRELPAVWFVDVRDAAESAIALAAEAQERFDAGAFPDAESSWRQAVVNIADPLQRHAKAHKAASESRQAWLTELGRKPAGSLYVNIADAVAQAESSAAQAQDEFESGNLNVAQDTWQRATSSLHGLLIQHADDDEEEDEDAEDEDAYIPTSPIHGVWEGTLSGLSAMGLPPEMDSASFTMSISVAEDGTITGTSTVEMMGQSETDDLGEITFDEATGEFTATDTEEGITSIMRGTLEGDTITGTWEVVEMGISGTFSVTKTEAEVEEEESDGGDAFTNSIGMELVYIEPGTFMMGSPSNEEGHDDDEGLQHRVTLTTGFHMGVTEVTQAQWRAVMGTNPSHFKGDDLPVETVSWNDAVAFCEKLSRSEGRTYRLPTEAEWEYACRAGTTTRFCFGNDDGSLSRYAWYYGNSGNKTHPVASKQPNVWGLHDMHGNVWEWCQDVWHDSYSGAPTDGSAWTRGGDQSRRVLRGGSWSYIEISLRCAGRFRINPVNRFYYFGFRLALD